MNVPALLPLCALLSCAAPATPSLRPDPRTWESIQRALEAERAATPRLPWSARVSVSLHEPRSGRVVDGRGAIAVAPGRALRLILVGAAGGTMLDAWVTADQFRVAIPPTGPVRRGNASSSDSRSSEDARDLPVGFLRWLFFTPLQGRLFAGEQEPNGFLFVLRDGEVVLEVRLRPCDRGRFATVTRRSPGRIERLDECRAGNAPHQGDWVTYQDDSTGLRCDLTIESVANEPPDDVAFRDPDAGGEVVY
jgi:hypothetical protein